MISLVGLLLQIGVALLMLIAAQYTGDHGTKTAAILFGSGAIVWFMLLLIYDQHRRERIEALEAEQLASSGGVSASAFEENAEDMRVAARRLAFIQKWIVPASGVLFALINIYFGYARLRDWNSFSSGETFIYNTKLLGATMAIGIALGVVGFVFARFVSGMGKVPAWSNLKAGAAQGVAISLIGILLAVAAFVELSLGQMAVKNITPLVIPIMMIVLGSEVVLNLVLDVYRPRKPGEDPRPAFDSRMLGLLAAPDRIAANIGEAVNYQFGVDVTGTWFYKILSKLVLWLAVLGFGLAWVMTMFVVVEPHERGLILNNGKVSEPLISFGESAEGEIGPGLHIKLPWPFSTYETPVSVSSDGGRDEQVQTTTGVRVLNLASNPPDPGKNEPIIWTESHASREMLNIVQPLAEEDRATDEGVSRSELSLVAAEIPVHYVVRDVKLFDQFAGPGQREDLLRVIGRRIVTQYLSEQSIDRILGADRAEMASEIRRRLESAYGELNNGQGPGIEIRFVGMHGAHPPQKVAGSFERVIEARQNRESRIEEAHRIEIQSLTDVVGSVELASEIVEAHDTLESLRDAGAPESEIIEAKLVVQRLIESAGGEAGEIVLGAGAERWEREMGERGRATLLAGQEAAYNAAPMLYRSRAYFDALLETMRGARVYLTPGDLDSFLIRMDLIDNLTSDYSLDPEAGAEFAN